MEDKDINFTNLIITETESGCEITGTTTDGQIRTIQYDKTKEQTEGFNQYCKELYAENICE